MRRPPDGDRIDILVTLVKAYEAKHYPIGEPDPIEAIIHRMDTLGITRIPEPGFGDYIPPMESHFQDPEYPT